MSKQIVPICESAFSFGTFTNSRQASVFCGIDVSRETLAGVKRRIEKLRREAIKLVQGDDAMRLRLAC